MNVVELVQAMVVWLSTFPSCTLLLISGDVGDNESVQHLYVVVEKKKKDEEEVFIKEQESEVVEEGKEEGEEEKEKD